MRQSRSELGVLHVARGLAEGVVSTSYLPLQYLSYIDDFGVHRNMYRALKALYVVPACLECSERRKLASFFTLTLGTNGANVDHVVEAFRQAYPELRSRHRTRC